MNWKQSNNSFQRLSFFKITNRSKGKKYKNVNANKTCYNLEVQKVQKKKIQYVSILYVWVFNIIYTTFIMANYSQLECFICKIRLKSMRIYNLKRHMKLHSNDLSRCKCLECGRSYSSYGNFVKHLPRRHANRNPEHIKYEPTNEGFQHRPLYFYQ